MNRGTDHAQTKNGLRSFPSGSLFIMDAITGTETINKGSTSLAIYDIHILLYNKNALSSVESRVFVDTISSEEANRARAFVFRGGGGGGGSEYKRAGDARRLA